MVGTDEALESRYLTAELVKNSPTKRLVVIAEGGYEEVTYDNETTRRLTLPVEIDGKEKLWRPNRDSISNMKEVFGADTRSWVRCTAKLQIIKMQGKESVIAIGVKHNSPE